MVIGTLQVDLSIPGAASLKDKRMVLRSLKDRIHRQFNVSIAELDDHDQWQSAILGIVVVSNDNAHANEMLSKVVDFIQQNRDSVLDDYQLRML
jgi:uncharacterized protein YlxP (DUF503 family)